VAAWVEVIVDESMSRKEILGPPGRFETLHLAFPTSVGRCELSERLLRHRLRRCSTLGRICRRVTPQLFSLSVTITRGSYFKPFSSRLKIRLAVFASRRG
jgi:hypothetical protein